MTALHYKYTITDRNGFEKVCGIFTLSHPNATLEVELLDALHVDLKNMDIINITGPYNCHRRFIYDSEDNELVDILDLIN